MRILVADDHEFFRESVARFLGGLAGVTNVFVAPDGQGALDAAHRFSPDLVILDYHLPDMKGTEAALHLRESKPAVQIILCSDGDEPESGYASQVDRFLLKDELFEQLPDLIQSLQV